MDMTFGAFVHAQAPVQFTLRNLSVILPNGALQPNATVIIRGVATAPGDINIFATSVDVLSPNGNVVFSCTPPCSFTLPSAIGTTQTVNITPNNTIVGEVTQAAPGSGIAYQFSNVNGGGFSIVLIGVITGSSGS